MEPDPYHYGAPVRAPWFCDREEEVATLTSRMRSGIHVFVLSPRRYGKTSVIHRASEEFERNGGRAAYVNLLFCTTELEVGAAILAAVLERLCGTRAKVRHNVQDLLGRVRVQPQITLDARGSISVALSPSLLPDVWVDVFDDALTLLVEVGERVPAALILDEFQVVATIGGGLGGAFKAAADRAERTSIVFSGSHLSVMQKLTSGHKAPLYGMGETLALGVIPEAPMVTYLRRRARSGGKALARGEAELIYRQAAGIPNYVQCLAYAAFEAAGDQGQITRGHVQGGLEAITRRLAGDFAERFEPLAPSQQRLVRYLAATPTSKPYTKVVLDAVQVANANAIKTALDALARREIVTRRTGEWQLVDPFLRHWLVQRSGG